MIQYTNSKHPKHLAQIIVLQEKNLANNISRTEAMEQGFVTVQHRLDLLEKMGRQYPHTVAIHDDEVVGYALTMERSFRTEIAVLVPMFDLIDQLTWNNKPLRDSRYLVMGQVCVDKAHRGQGLFKGLYHQMRSAMQPHFEILVTEIAERNTRSMRAHEKVGFVPLHKHTSDGENWVIVGWDWREPH